MFIATKYKYRSAGYASIFIREFIDYIKTKYTGKFDNIAIILDSVQPAVTFYEHFGFKWTTTEKKYDEVFHIDEKNANEHFIMVYKL
jgi:predicted GNAT family N-acyltransferase